MTTTMGTDVTSAEDDGAPRAWRVEGDRVLRVASAGLMAGLAAGLVVAGVGGRIAMRVVALQSPDAYQGMLTDDGAPTGEITLAGSVNLIAFLTLVGGMGGLVYALVRDALPARGRPLAWGAVTGSLVGSLVIHSDGVDYDVLGSRWVSVAMFAAISLAYGAVVALLAERFLAPAGVARTASTRRLALPFLTMLAGLTIVPLAVAMGAVVAARALGLVERVRRFPVALVVRGVLVVAVLAACVDLVRTVGELA